MKIPMTKEQKEYQKGFQSGKQEAQKEFKENLLHTKSNHELGCMLECYAEVIGYRIGFTKESIKLEQIASKLK